MELKKIIKEIEVEYPEVTSVIFVGCGISQAELYPTKYFLEGNVKRLKISLYTANEFVHVTPACVNKESIVITCSLGGNTPETVGASKKTMNTGAKITAITHTPDSPLANSTHYMVLHGSEGNYATKLERMTLCLQLAAEVLNQYEGHEHYQDMVTGLAKISDLIEDTVSFIVPSVKEFAESYRDTPIIHVMGPGATHIVAYSSSICLLVEMQWINSDSFHDGEFFCGSFEIVGRDVPFPLLVNDGSTRALDSRAPDFLNRFQVKTTLTDARDFGLGSVVPSTVKDYFNPMLITAILRVYAEQLVILKNRPLTQRRYIWKLEY